MSTSATNHVTGLENGQASYWWEHTYPVGEGTQTDEDSSSGPWNNSYDTTVTYPGFYDGAYYGMGYGGGREEYFAYLGDAFSDYPGSDSGMFPFAFSDEELLLRQGQTGGQYGMVVAAESSSPQERRFPPLDAAHGPSGGPLGFGRGSSDQRAIAADVGAYPSAASLRGDRPGGVVIMVQGEGGSQGEPESDEPAYRGLPEIHTPGYQGIGSMVAMARDMAIQAFLKAGPDTDVGKLMSHVKSKGLRRILAEVLWSVNDVILVPGGANRCHRWTESARDKILAMGKLAYRNNEWEIEYVEWGFPPVGGWLEHGGLRIRFSDGAEAYFDNGVLGGRDHIAFPENVPGTWRVQNTQALEVAKGYPPYVSLQDLAALPEALWRLLWGE